MKNNVFTRPAGQSPNNMNQSIVRLVVVPCMFMLAGAAARAQQAPAAAAAQTQSAQPPAPSSPTVPGGLNLNGASLLEVINLLAQDLHINYVLDPGVKGGTVTINTYGVVREVDLRPLLETILRMNGLAMVQVGEIFRIVPAANVARQPVSPISQSDASKLPDDERIVLNLVFLRYVTSGEMSRILLPFLGEGAQMTNYDPANLLILLDNGRNMRRTLELIAMFDSDTFAGQRVRAFDIKNGRPSDIGKELDQIFQASALSDKAAAVRFLAIDRINTIIAVAPNPSTFTKVEDWLLKLDIPLKVTHGSIDNYVFKLKYARAEIIGSAIMQLYGGGCGMGGGYSPYGGMPGISKLSASGSRGSFGGIGGGYPGANGASGYGSGYGPVGALRREPVWCEPIWIDSLRRWFPLWRGLWSPVLAGGSGGWLPYGDTGPLAPYRANQLPASTGGTTPERPPTPERAGQTGTYLGAAHRADRVYSVPRIIPNPFDNTFLVQGHA